MHWDSPVEVPNINRISNFKILFGNMLSAEWLHLGLYFAPEFNNSRQNIIILFWKYLVDFRSEAWLHLFWEYINGKFFTVRGAGGGGCIYKKVRLIFSSGKQQLEPPPPTISLSICKQIAGLCWCSVPREGRETCVYLLLLTRNTCGLI